MKKFKLTTNLAPTPKKLDALCREVCLARAGQKSELSGTSKDFAVLQWHHILHKPNHRLRWELSNIIILTQAEHKSYHYHEERAVYDPSAKETAERMFQRFLDTRGTTHDNLLMLKRCGVVNKIALFEWLTLKLKEFEANNLRSSL